MDWVFFMAHMRSLTIHSIVKWFVSWSEPVKQLGSTCTRDFAGVAAGALLKEKLGKGSAEHIAGSKFNEMYLARVIGRRIKTILSLTIKFPESCYHRDPTQTLSG